MSRCFTRTFSGRQEIWTELWQAFSRSPVTGIGSGYELKSFEIFEVHNGMFDILTVHGTVVFVLVVVMLWRACNRVYINLVACSRSAVSGSSEDGSSESNGTISLHKRTARIAVASAFAMMFTSYFENYFTVPPYNIFFMTFLLMALDRQPVDMVPGARSGAL